MSLGPYRAGPWPGLTPSGAAVLVGCAVLLAAIDLSGLRFLSLVPLAVAARVVNAPGAASAACGAYLLARSLVSLVQPSVELPPLLLIPAMAFDVALWVRASDIPRRRPKWFRRVKAARTPTLRRAAAAGALFGAALCAVEGVDPWTAVLTLVVSTLVSAVSVRGTASSPPAGPTR